MLEAEGHALVISSAEEKTSCKWHHMDELQRKEETITLSDRDRKPEGPGEAPVLFSVYDPLERIKSGPHEYSFKPKALPVDPTFYGFCESTH